MSEHEERIQEIHENLILIIKFKKKNILKKWQELKMNNYKLKRIPKLKRKK